MFSDIMLKAMTEEAVVALKGGVAKLDVFSTNWSPMEGQIGDGVCCPIYSLSAATDFDAEQNNFGGGETPDGVYIPLSKFLTKAVTLSDKEIQGSGITYGRKTAQAIANSLAAGANAYVFGQLSASGITLSASVNLSSKQNIAQLYATAENNGLDVGSTVVVLTPTEYSKILAELSYDVLGSDRAVAAGKVDHAFGFKSIICASLPSALSAKGYLIQDCALGVVSRYLPPADEGATEAWKVESDYGLTIGYRRVYDAIRGRSSLAGTLLMGCQVAVPSRIVKLV